MRTKLTIHGSRDSVHCLRKLSRQLPCLSGRMLAQPLEELLFPESREVFGNGSVVTGRKAIWESLARMQKCSGLAMRR
jgi:hypothetical protein